MSVTPASAIPYTEAGPELSIVMPAHNEADCIRQVIQEWSEALDSVGLTQESMARIIIINDGSTDATAQILAELEKADKRIRQVECVCGGHGRAILYGYRLALQSGARFIFQVDSDNEFDPADFAPLWRSRHRSPFVFGCRTNRNSPRHRRLISFCLRIIVLMVFQVRTPDPNVPYRLINRRYLRFALERIPENVFIPNVYMSIIAHRQRIPVTYVPISHRQRTTGKVSIHSWRLLRACAASFGRLVAWRINVRSMPRYAIPQAAYKGDRVIVQSVDRNNNSCPPDRVDNSA